jgi:outer membrane protein assembly factor BamB
LVATATLIATAATGIPNTAASAATAEPTTVRSIPPTTASSGYATEITGRVGNGNPRSSTTALSLAGGAVAVKLSWSSARAELRATLMTSAGRRIASTGPASGQSSEFSTTVPTAGQYRLVVEGRSGSSDFGANVVQASNVVRGTNWSRFHMDNVNGGVTPDSTIGAGNASGLALQWEANIGSASFTSPAVVYNSTLAEELVIVGDQGGTLAAYNALNGNRVWVAKLGASVQSSPEVVNGTVWVGDSDHKMYAINYSTGATVCDFDTSGVISSSPVIGNPDGRGNVVYFGDSGVTGGDDGGDMWAINASNCSLRWRFTSYGEPAGTWSPVSFARLANGTAVVLFGGSSPDNAEYEVNASTGALRWRFQTQVFSEDDDVGAGTTIQAPGVNGFADGVAYVPGKDRIFYALDLQTGAKIWEYDVYRDDPQPPSSTRSTAALDGNVLYFGAATGMYALSAVTGTSPGGTKLWRSDQVAGGSPTSEILSSPAVTGTSGQQLVVAGDITGKMYGWNATTGKLLWSYAAGNYIYSSPVVVGGQMYFTSGDGFLYAFGFGGAYPNPKPVATITSPISGSTVPNTGSLAISGSATSGTGVASVLIAVQEASTGKWWNATTHVWSPIFSEAPSTLGSPNSTSTSFSTTVPVTADGGHFNVQADAVDIGGQHNALVAKSQVLVSSLTDPPSTSISQPTLGEIFYFPDPSDPSFPITITGTSTDTLGQHPGVAKVFVVVKNIEHNDYYCGSTTCGATGSQPSNSAFQAYSPVYTALPVPLSNPGATSVQWSYSFLTYDDPAPFAYRITAWAVDNDGNVQPVKTIVNRICVNNVGNNRCPAGGAGN